MMTTDSEKVIFSRLQNIVKLFKAAIHHLFYLVTSWEFGEFEWHFGNKIKLEWHFCNLTIIWCFELHLIELQCSLVCRGRSHSRKREAVQDQKRFQSFPFQNSEQREPTGKDIKHNYYSYSRTFRTML